MNLKGTFFIFVFIILVPLCGVYQAHLSQTISPSLFIFFTALTTMITFSVVCYSKNKFHLIRKSRSQKMNIVVLNISTFLTWFFYMYSLKYLEPALAIIIGNAIGPLLIVVFSQYLRPQSQIFKIEKMATIGIFLSLVFIVCFSLQGESALKQLDADDVLIGIIFSFIMGIGQVLFSIYSKKLSDVSFSPSEILVLRHPMIVIVSLFLLNKENLTPILTNSHLGIGIFVICIGMIIAVYCYQQGLKLTEPIFVSILILIEPIMMFFYQIFDPRLKISIFSYTGVAFIVLFSLMSLVGRHYQSKKLTSTCGF